MADPHLAPLSSQDLRRGLESLPQELYDQIHKNVFTAPPGIRALEKVNSGPDQCQYKIFGSNVKLLHVSSSTRALYAKTYYGHGATFELHAATFEPPPPGNFITTPETTNVLVAWLRMLPPSHRAILTQVTVVLVHKPALDGKLVRVFTSIINAIRRRVEEELGGDTELAAKVLLKADGKVYDGK